VESGTGSGWWGGGGHLCAACVGLVRDRDLRIGCHVKSKRVSGGAQQAERAG